MPENRTCRSGSLIPKKSPDPYAIASAGFESIGSFDELWAVSEASVWQDFERLVAFIFEKNGFAISIGTVKTRLRQRRQYDVIAQKNGRTLLVECKRWSGNRYRLSALRAAVGKHRERAQFYERVTGTGAVPVLVTLIEEEIRLFEGVPLVPVHRLNAFIRELDPWGNGFQFPEMAAEETGDTDPCTLDPDAGG